MTEGSKAVFDFLKGHPNQEFTKHQIVEGADLTMAVVNATVNWLLRKNYASKRVEVQTRNGQEFEKVFVQITSSGIAYDPEEEEREKKKKQMEAAAARKEARLKARAELAKKNLIL